MENKIENNDPAQIYLRPKKNAQIKIGSSYQAQLPDTVILNKEKEHSDIFPSQNSDKSIHYSNIEKNLIYNEHYIAVKEIYYNSTPDDDVIKPGKKRRIEN